MKTEMMFYVIPSVIVLCLQLVIFGFFIIFGKYDVTYNSETYPMFQDIHAMIFVGFGFLMTFLKRYGYSAVGFNFLIGALMLQWSIICQGFYALKEESKIAISIESLYKADIATASVLISMGAVLGCTTYMQLVFMGLVEIVVYSLNFYLGSTFLKTSDTGGSIFVHTFGAYFGLAVSYTLGRRQTGDNSLEVSSYTSDIFSMIGTIFLWIYWPSFNAIGLPPCQQSRAIINTYLSLSSSCVLTFVTSLWKNPKRKIDMVHIQNSTLAGGVAIGTVANLLVQPYGAILVGMLAGIISVIGFVIVTPLLNNKCRLHDTCGVNNLHGMPGILGGLIGAFMTSIATKEDYQDELYQVFPGRFKEGLNSTFTEERSPSEQAGYQLLSIFLTLMIALVSGSITGLVISCKSFKLGSQQFYNDDAFWSLNEEAAPIQAAINVRQKSQSQLMLLKPSCEQ